MVPIILGCLIGVVVLVLLFKPIFGGLDEFLQCVKFWFTPDIISLFRGEYTEDWLSEMKLGLWLAAGGIAGVLSYVGLAKMFG